MKEKKIFFRIWLFQVITIKGGKIHISRHNWIFRRTCCIISSHWQSSGIMTFLCKYYIILDVLFLLLALILSGLHEIPRRHKIEIQKKAHRRICVRDIFWLHALLSMSLFVAFFVYSFPLPKWRLAKWPL